MRQLQRKNKFRKICNVIKRIALGGMALSVFSFYLLESTDKSVGVETTALLMHVARIAVSASVCSAIYLFSRWKERDIKSDIRRTLQRWER